MVRRRTVTRVRYRRVPSASRGRRYSSGGFGGIFAPIIAGGAASIVSQFAGRYLGQWGGPVGVGAVGYFLKNPTLMTIAGMQAGNLVNIGGYLGGGAPGPTQGGAI